MTNPTPTQAPATDAGLRLMLCAAIGGGLAYMDDGEAQFDGIDFKRLSVSEIREALRRRAMRLASQAPTQPSGDAGAGAVPVGHLLLNKNGLIEDFHPRVREFFGAILDDDAYQFDDEWLAKRDRDYPGLAPHSTAFAYASPLPQVREPAAMRSSEFGPRDWVASEVGP